MTAGMCVGIACFVWCGLVLPAARVPAGAEHHAAQGPAQNGPPLAASSLSVRLNGRVIAIEEFRPPGSRETGGPTLGEQGDLGSHFQTLLADHLRKEPIRRLGEPATPTAVLEGVARADVIVSGEIIGVHYYRGQPPIVGIAGPVYLEHRQPRVELSVSFRLTDGGTAPAATGVIDAAAHDQSAPVPWRPPTALRAQTMLERALGNAVAQLAAIVELRVLGLTSPGPSPP